MIRKIATKTREFANTAVMCNMEHPVVVLTTEHQLQTVRTTNNILFGS